MKSYLLQAICLCLPSPVALSPPIVNIISHAHGPSWRTPPFFPCLSCPHVCVCVCDPDRQTLIRKALSHPAGLLLTTYDQLRLHRALLLPQRWGYVVLDEGHKIRNPDAEVTLVCKQVGGSLRWVCEVCASRWVGL